jgi:hypothetical protein
MKQNAEDGIGSVTTAPFRTLTTISTQTQKRRHSCRLCAYLNPVPRRGDPRVRCGTGKPTVLPALLAFALLFAACTAVCAAQSPATAPAKSDPIPMDQIGAVAGKQYQGDGLSVAATPEGARLRCVFQKLAGQATREGLWLTSTTDDAKGERFRVVAVGAGRVTPCAPSEIRDGSGNDGAHGVTRPAPQLPRAGEVVVADQMVRFIRSGLTEEYSVSMDGVRQDFVVLERPEGAGQLRVKLDVTGARAEQRAGGARLVLDGSGRKIAYSRLRATDAQGKELMARIEVGRALRCAPTDVRDAEGTNGAQGVRTLPAKLAVVVDDTDAVYPVRIDPTFSDENWISMNPSIPGVGGTVWAAVLDDSGYLYIGGSFTAVGDVIATNIARWNGSGWTALGSGMNDDVLALAVSGSDLYAGGYFNTAGGVSANHIAKWNGSSWTALGSGTDSSVCALAVSGVNVFAGGYFTTAGGVSANRVAKWNGSSWSALGSGMNGGVYSLAVSGSDLYAGGWFTTATNSGGVAVTVNSIAKWNGSSWTALGSGMGHWLYSPSVRALAVAGSAVYAGGSFTMAGGVSAICIAKWNGSSWTALGSGMDDSDDVYALAVSGSDLYVGGYFTTPGGVSANRIAKWNGSTWSALGSGMNGGVYSLAVSASAVYAGGAFTTAGGVSANHIAKWNGTSWTALGSGMDGDASESVRSEGA